MGHYETLGVESTASDIEIKKTYRKLSLKYHPDRNTSADAGEQIRKINDAYDTLGDPSKRKQYDMELKYGDNPFAQFTGGDMPFMRMPTMHGPEGDIGELFSALFGGMGGGGGGDSPNIRIFHEGMGIPMGGMGMPMGGMGMPRRREPKILRKPDAIVKTISITLEQSYHGCKLPIEVERTVTIDDVQITEEETIYVDLYPGVDHNECIMIQDKGHITTEQIKGDIKVNIVLQNTTEFKRDGLDLIYHKTITLKESLCGFSFKLTHLHGNDLLFNNNAKTTIVTPNFKKIIPNMGMRREKNTGNLIVNFHIEFPTSLSTTQIESLNEIL